jgi:hypothetical protein
MRALVLPITYLCFYHTFVTGPIVHKTCLSMSLVIYEVFLMFIVLFPLSLVCHPMFVSFHFLLGPC